LYVGSTNASGTYSLNGGLLSTYASWIGFLGGKGNFVQSGGTNLVANSLYLSGIGLSGSGSVFSLGGSGKLSAPTENVGDGGTGTFLQSGGTNTVSTINLGTLSHSLGTFDLAGGDLILSALSEGPGSGAFNFSGGTLTAGTTFATSASIALAGGGSGATIDTAGRTLTLTGLLSGPGSLTRLDAGTLILTGTNTYTGGTTVSDGTLVIANPWAIEDGTSLTVGDVAAFAGGNSTSIAVNSNDLAPNVVPEPSTLALLGACAAGITGIARRKRWLWR